MEFVNIHGDKVNTAAPATKTAKSKPANDAYHKGWLVTGHSPEQVDEYKSKLGGAPFDPLSFARNTKFTKVRTKPYESQQAAAVCQEMAIKSGWLNVEVRPVVKGVK